MDGRRNMAGLTEREIRARLEERGCCAAAAAVCLGAVALVALVALVMALCERWPALCDRLPPIGFIVLGVALQMAWRAARDGRASHGD